MPKKGGVAVLLELVELFVGREVRAEYEEKYVGEGIRYKDLKEELAVAIGDSLAPIQTRRHELDEDSAYVDRVIAQGTQKAGAIAKQTLAAVKEAMGLPGK